MAVVERRVIGGGAPLGQDGAVAVVTKAPAEGPRSQIREAKARRLKACCSVPARPTGETGDRRVGQSAVLKSQSSARANYDVISIQVNGESRALPGPLDVAKLIDALDLAGKRIAVERNGEIVPRSRFRDTQLADGDRLEIVVAVGGG